MKVPFFFIGLFSLITQWSIAQNEVSWSYLYDNNTKTIHIQAQIAEGWHLYSQHISNDIGPVPTSIVFQENPDVQFSGDVKEPESIHQYDETFDAMLDYFTKEVDFSSQIKVKNTTTVKGTITFMVCNDTMCMPPEDVLFSIDVQP